MEDSVGDHFIVYSDGAARGNPGPAGIGGLVLSGGGEVLAEVRRYIGETTNNVAEYMALVVTLEEARRFAQPGASLEVKADSQLLVRQLIGGYRVKSKNLLPLYQRVRSLLDGFGEVRVTHVGRADNAEADALANHAIDDFLATVGRQGPEPPGTDLGEAASGVKGRADDRTEKAGTGQDTLF